ncbi:MAG: hypothetical protein QM755_14075 [Luteolibacter sp.]
MALSNARQIGLALYDFDSDYGRFPDATTITTVKESTGTTWDLKDRTSNDLFKQLFVTGIVRTEEIFRSAAFGSHTPDNVISSETKTLEPGECGFAYIAGGTSKSDPARPVAVTPLIPGTLKFDPAPLKGKAVILRADSSVITRFIGEDGRVTTPDGKHLFDPAQPYWKDAPPDVKWADLPVPPHLTKTNVAWVPVVSGLVVGGLIISILRGRKMLLAKSPFAAAADKVPYSHPMEVLPQPPPGIPAPPPGAEALRSKRWMKSIIWIGVGSIALLLLSGLVAPLLLRSQKKPNSTQALSNARQIGLALYDFDSDYGRFPDASTIPLVKSATHTTLDLKSGTSNDLFKQIIATDICTSEEIFYAKVEGARKPDNVISSDAKILQRGECGFAYIAGATSKCNPMRPLAVTPLIPGTLKFDPKPFDGRAIILRADNSAGSYIIRKDGTVVAPGGKDLFDPSQPYWVGAPPDVKWADLPPPAPSIEQSAAWSVALIPIVVIPLFIWVRTRSRKKHPLAAFREA